MEKKPSKWRRTAPYWICGALLTAAFGVFALRLFQWQVKDSDTYLEIANATSLSTVSIDAARGEILDRDGNALASNKTAYKVVFEKDVYKRQGCGCQAGCFSASGVKSAFLLHPNADHLWRDHAGNRRRSAKNLDTH